MSFINPLLPVMAEKLTLTLTQVGLVTGTAQLMAFVVQPSVGYLADRYRTRLFVLGGPLLSAIFIPLFGWATGFYMLIMLTLIGAIGQSMFHPPAAGMVPLYAGRHLGFSMAVFIFGGTAAFGLGPVFVTWYVSRFGLHALPVVGLAGAAAVIILYILVPRPAGEGLKEKGLFGSLKEILFPVWKPLLIIFVIIVLRTYVMQAVMTFVPILFSREGFDLISVGVIISIFTTAGAISGLVAGHLADHIGYKPVFYGSYCLTSLSLYLFLNSSGPWVFVGAFLAGFITMATLPLATAMAQTLVVKGQSLVASLTMGLAFGVGGLLSPLTGKMADIFSIRTVLGVLIWIPLLATVLIRFLPDPKR